MDRKIFFTNLAVLAVIAVALLALKFSFVLLLAFAGVLLGVLLRSLATLLSRHTPLPVGASLAVVILAIAAAITMFVIFAGSHAASQLLQVAEQVPAAWQKVQDYLSAYRWGSYLLEVVPQSHGLDWDLTRFLGPSVSIATTVIVNIFVVLAVGVFLAADPRLYRRGLMHLVPKHARRRAHEVLDALGNGLWRWMIGQGLDMIAVGLMIGTGLWLLGIQTPATLGMIAGVTNFIPYVGPFLGGVPVVLAALSQSSSDAWHALLLVIVIQQIDGHVLMPLIQKKTSSLPPALTIFAVLMMGGVYGFVGMLLATPLLLTGMVVTRMLYVEEMLDDYSVEEPIE